MATELYWEDAAFLITAEVLNEKFEVHPHLFSEEEHPNLFMRPLAGDHRTYDAREELTALGGRWIRGEKTWAIPVTRYTEALQLLASQNEAVQTTQ